MVSRIDVIATEFQRTHHGLSRAASFPCVEAARELEADRREAALQSEAVAVASDACDSVCAARCVHVERLCL
jgi:hypothetical protein